jgi:class 3 adenylate cyclase
MHQSVLDRIDQAVLSIMFEDLLTAGAQAPWTELPDWVRAWFDAETLIAQRRLREAVEMFDQVALRNDVTAHGQYRILSGLANAWHDLGDFEATRNVIRRIDLDMVDHPGYRGRITRLAAACAASEGRYDEAISLGERAVEGYSTGPYHAALGNTLTELATTYNRVGRLSDSIRCQYRAYDAYETCGVALARAIALINLGAIFGEIGNKLEAKDYFTKARSIPLTQGGERIELWCALNLGLLDLEGEQPEDALANLQSAARLGRDLQMWSTVIGAERGRAAAYRMLGDHDRAQRHLDDVRSLLDQYPNEPLNITAQVEQARLYNALARFDDTLHLALPMLADARERSDVSAIVRLLEVVSIAQAGIGLYEEAYHSTIELMTTQRSIEDASTQQQIAALKIDQELKAERAAAARERELLRGLLPASIAQRLIAGEQRIADIHANVAVLFADIVGFTSMAGRMPPAGLIDLLGQIFTMFDEIMARYDLVRIKTIGDAYMAVALPNSEQRVASSEQRVASSEQRAASSEQRTASAAVAMLRTLAERLPHISIRIGVHCGDVVAGVIGTDRPMFDVWGDTVNVASRMESTGEPGRIHVSEAFAKRLDAVPQPPDTITLTPRGMVEVKGKGAMQTYWLEHP